MTTQNTPAIYHFDGNIVRVVTGQDGEPWFVANDVGKILRLVNVHTSIKKLDEDEKGLQTLYTLGGNQILSVINESGLYTLILRCNDAVTPGSIPHRFRKWITSEVIPSIRKTGAYVTGQPSVSGSSNLDIMAHQLKLLTAMFEEAQQVQARMF